MHPGFIRTAMTEAVPAGTSGVALGRPGEPEKIGTVVVFLASDESWFSTGAEFVADGSETAGDPTGGSLSGMVGPSGTLPTTA